MFRHEKYVNQYRAMFVRNCKVKTDQILREGKSKRKNRKGKAADPSTTTSEAESKGQAYHPVCCEVCSTEVGVFDEDEVYHFFNVIPSNSWILVVMFWGLLLYKFVNPYTLWLYVILFSLCVDIITL